MIKPKLKQCSSCKQMVILWKSTPKLCKDCAMKIKLQDETGLNLNVKVKPKKGIAPISEKMQSNLAKYRRLRDAYFKEHPVCEFPGCASKNITLHHKKGRCGALLTDKRNFCSLCLQHHTFVNENPTEALKLGLVINRLDK
jgi:hypothetical protein